MYRSDGRPRRLKLSITASGSGWHSVDITQKLGRTGTLLGMVLRMDTGGAATAGEVKVFQGRGYTTSTVPTAVPDEDVILHQQELTYTASATVASADVDIQGTVGARAVYDLRGTPRDPDQMLLSLNTDGAGTFAIVLVYAETV